MRPAIVELRELSKKDVLQLTEVLSRRPDYGIARPSNRWLNGQKEKVDGLPKTLLNTKNRLQRFGIDMLTKLDKHQEDEDKVLPPRAILCHAHERLNQFLIREIFLALTSEVSGDYMSALREWPGKNPAISAFLTRLDSIHAFWVSRKVFEDLFGTSPHDDRFVRIESSCEACILAAIGANGQILADLFAWVKVRMDDVKNFNRDAKRVGNGREDDNEVEVRGRAESVAAELVQIWPSISKLSADKQKAARKGKGTYRQMLRTKGDDSDHVTEARGADRGFNIRLPQTNLESAALQRNMAELHNVSDAASVYRDGTVVDVRGMYTDSVIADFQRLGLDLQNRAGQDTARTGAPASPADASVNRSAAEGQPAAPNTQHHASRNNDDRNEQDDTYQHEYDERDYAEEAASVLKVQSWYQQQAFSTTKTNLGNLDTESVHPAFATNRSALPEALDIRRDKRAESYQPARKGWEQPVREAEPEILHPNADARSEWEDASVYTTADAFESVNLAGQPPMPQIPSRYTDSQRGRSDLPHVDTTSSVPGLSSVPSLSPDRGSNRTFSPHSSSRGGREDPFEYDEQQQRPPPQPPMPGPADFASRPPERPPQTKADRRKYLFHDDESVAASHLTMTNKKYLRQNKGKIKEVPVEVNPFVRKESKRVKRDGEMMSPISPRFAGTGGGISGGGPPRPQYEGYAALNREAEERARRAHDEPMSPRSGGNRSNTSSNARPRYEGYAALNREAEERARRTANRNDDAPLSPRSGGSRSNTAANERPRHEGYAALNREAEERAARDAARSRGQVYPYSPNVDTPPTPRFGSPRMMDQGRGGRNWGDNASEVRPIDSASNVAWRKDSQATTTLGDFIDSHRNHDRRR
ncbi:hypothetical protein G7054_g2241 [Neopestalotiopsis clavispora]|nr:hypothetical protein G7054_g2241 [Neopestalotiopsis clavispora]